MGDFIRVPRRYRGEKEVRPRLINALDRRRISGWVIKRVTIESRGVARGATRPAGRPVVPRRGRAVLLVARRNKYKPLRIKGTSFAFITTFLITAKWLEIFFSPCHHHHPSPSPYLPLPRARSAPGEAAPAIARFLLRAARKHTALIKRNASNAEAR